MGRIATACVTLLLAACGQRGELYIPESRGEVVTAPSATTPASGDDAEERARREAARTPAAN